MKPKHLVNRAQVYADDREGWPAKRLNNIIEAPIDVILDNNREVNKTAADLVESHPHF